MNINQRISAFVKLGLFLKSFNVECEKINIIQDSTFEKNNYNLILSAINYTLKSNGWFTRDNIIYAMKSIADSLNEDDIKKWIVNEGLNNKGKNSINIVKNVNVILAGNIPLVGFHDFLCVLISGNRFIGKLSSADRFLLPAISKILIKIEPGFKDFIYFKQDTSKNIELIIATGSNNSSRYFENYFIKYPHIIRKNRNSIAILKGNESKANLKNLCFDMFLYYGLGCRNVSKLYVPQGYSFNNLIEVTGDFKFISDNKKYINNYNYHKAIFKINKIKHIDSGFFLLKEDHATYSPVSVINYELYNNLETLKTMITRISEQIQCVVTDDLTIPLSVSFGNTQSPKLWNYSDNLNVIQFLKNN